MEQRLHIDIACSIMTAMNAICEDRALKLADMIKGSADEEKREKYKLKRNYYRQEAKRACNMLYDAVKMHDIKLSRNLKKHNKGKEEESLYRISDMLDFTDEALKNEILELRSVLRKQAKKSDPEDLTIIGHMLELVSLSAMCRQYYDYFTRAIPVLAYDMDKKFFRCDGFWNISLKCMRSMDCRGAGDPHLKLDADEILMSKETEDAMMKIKDKMFEVAFVDKMIEAREGEDPHYRDILKSGSIVEKTE